MAKKSPKKSATASKSAATKRVAKKAAATRKATAPRKPLAKSKSGKPVLLSGGNPQIAKGDGNAPVQTYIAAMPDWKGDIGRRLDALIVATVPHVKKAVKWNTPFYGIEGEGWFLGFHCITKYVKVVFFRGRLLKPMPPIESTQKEVRYLHIFEDGEFDVDQFTDWVKQASRMPGERM